LDLFGADSRSPESSIGSSGYGLLPMQGGFFDMNDTDQYAHSLIFSLLLLTLEPSDFLSMNFELDATQSFMGSELFNDFSNFTEPYPPIP
jgi:hypothetical protein